MSLVASMPTISTSGRDTRSSRSASAAATARPPSGLWPPSSQSSLPARRQRGERARATAAACAPAIRPSQAGLVGGGGSFQAIARSVAIAVPALSN